MPIMYLHTKYLNPIDIIALQLLGQQGVQTKAQKD